MTIVLTDTDQNKTIEFESLAHLWRNLDKVKPSGFFRNMDFLIKQLEEESNPKEVQCPTCGHLWRLD